jgi:hypothetical protein
MPSVGRWLEHTHVRDVRGPGLFRLRRSGTSIGATEGLTTTAGHLPLPVIGTHTLVAMAPTTRGRRDRYHRSIPCDGLRLVVAAVSAFIVAVVVPISSALAKEDDPGTVVDAYESARDRGDMDAVVAFFAEDAVVVDSAGAMHRGRQQIRMLLQPGVHPDWSVAVIDRTLDGDHVFWTERVGVHGTARPLSVAAIVRDGSIRELAYGGRELISSTASSSVAAPLLPAALGLVSVLLAAVSSLGIVVVSRSQPGRTILPGSRLAHLQRWSEGRSHRQPESQHAR